MKKLILILIILLQVSFSTDEWVKMWREAEKRLENVKEDSLFLALCEEKKKGYAPDINTKAVRSIEFLSSPSKVKTLLKENDIVIQNSPCFSQHYNPFSLFEDDKFHDPKKKEAYCIQFDDIPIAPEIIFKYDKNELYQIIIRYDSQDFNDNDPIKDIFDENYGILIDDHYFYCSPNDKEILVNGKLYYNYKPQDLVKPEYLGNLLINDPVTISIIEISITYLPLYEQINSRNKKKIKKTF